MVSIEKKFSILAGIVVLHFLRDAVLLLLGFDFVKELVVLQVKDPILSAWLLLRRNSACDI